MRTLVEVATCDICGKETECKELSYPVICDRSANDGMPIEPFIFNAEIDVCEDCLPKVLRIGDRGAQGHNKCRIIDGEFVRDSIDSIM